MTKFKAGDLVRNMATCEVLTVESASETTVDVTDTDYIREPIIWQAEDCELVHEVVPVEKRSPTFEDANRHGIIQARKQLPNNVAGYGYAWTWMCWQAFESHKSMVTHWRRCDDWEPPAPLNEVLVVDEVARGCDCEHCTEAPEHPIWFCTKHEVWACSPHRIDGVPCHLVEPVCLK